MQQPFRLPLTLHITLSATFITSRDIDNLDDILTARFQLHSQRDYVVSNKK
jgi:hypothetical protein